MEAVTGLDLKTLATQADAEYLDEQAERIKRQIRNLNGEIGSYLTKVGQLESELTTFKKRLVDAQQRKARIIAGEWNAVPEYKDKPPYDAKTNSQDK